MYIDLNSLYMYVTIYTYIQTYIHIYIHAYMHIHTYIWRIHHIMEERECPYWTSWHVIPSGKHSVPGMGSILLNPWSKGSCGHSHPKYHRLLPKLLATLHTLMVLLLKDNLLMSSNVEKSSRFLSKSFTPMD